MPIQFRFAMVALLSWLTPPATAADAPAPVTIFLSLDAFRADYLDRGLTPSLQALAANGISATLRPSFPTKTYPNHYAMVTGLRPDRNGIVSNKMEDAARPGETFNTKNDGDAFWWSQAEPIWAAAERTGLRSAVSFYPGSKVAWRGIRPRDLVAYDETIDDAHRITAAIEWLRRPADSRPHLIVLYLNALDKAGHTFGPDSPELAAALGATDGQIARLRTAITDLKLAANLVVVSDHGMAAITPKHVLWLHEMADPADYRLIEDGSVAMITARPGHEAALAKRLLRSRPHVDCRRKADLPPRYHYGRNPRVAPFVCVAEVGWMVMDAIPKWGLDRGTHGYDNRAPDMQAIFMAEGPNIRPLGRLPRVDNVDIYPLLRDLLGLSPKRPIDGSDQLFRRALRVTAPARTPDAGSRN